MKGACYGTPMSSGAVALRPDRDAAELGSGNAVDWVMCRPLPAVVDADHAELAPIFSEEERRQLAAGQVPLPKPFRLTKTP